LVHVVTQTAFFCHRPDGHDPFVNRRDFDLIAGLQERRRGRTRGPHRSGRPASITRKARRRRSSLSIRKSNCSPCSWIRSGGNRNQPRIQEDGLPIDRRL